MTEVDPDLARAVFGMRTRHGLFRDGNGDTRSRFAPLDSKNNMPARVTSSRQLFPSSTLPLQLPLAFFFTFILKLCLSRGRLGSCLIGIS